MGSLLNNHFGTTTKNTTRGDLSGKRVMTPSATTAKIRISMKDILNTELNKDKKERAKRNPEIMVQSKTAAAPLKQLQKSQIDKESFQNRLLE
jgi:TATA-box binding protein (TBP) (component of TFIID and TFIIIB)